MKCKHCKNQIPDGSIFCNFCGQRQIKGIEIAVPAPTVTASGKFYGRVVAPNGARISVTEITEAKYYAKARAIKSGNADIKKAAPGKSLGAVVDKFIKDNEAVLSPSTVRGYFYANKRLESIADRDADKIDYQVFISGLTGKYSPKTIKNTWSLVCAALEYNKIPVPSVNLPAVVRKDEGFLDYAEILEFLTAIKDRPVNYQLAYCLALSGLRLSEILALNKDSLRGGVIKVRGAVVRDKSGAMVYKESNKNDSSRRDVPVFIPAITELWEECGELNFPYPTNLYDGLLLTCKKAKLPPVSMHDLRRSFASLCHHLQLDVITVQKLGGWANTDTLNRIYTKLSEKDKNADVEKLKEFFENGE